MELYTDPAKVDEYEKMCDGYEGSELYKLLADHLHQGASLLELGSGPGIDIHHLSKQYSVTGSDLSDEFLKRNRIKSPNIHFLKLDAVSIETKQPFECLFSNKVLHHLTLEELEKSFFRQTQVLSPNGLFAHTFWLGEKEFEMEGMLFVFHNREELITLVSKYFKIVKLYDYKEFEEGDSIFILATKD